MVFSDLPYNVPIHGHATGNGAIRHREFAMASGEMTEAEYRAFLITVLAAMASFSTDSSLHYVCEDWRHIGDLLTAGRQTYDELVTGQVLRRSSVTAIPNFIRRSQCDGHCWARSGADHHSIRSALYP